ncbi:MAG: SHOCT domain-containing protein [Anaerolineales bacterium]|nr:SHOCT domain-containing protein [Anaerolineales bacterium]
MMHGFGFGIGGFLGMILIWGLLIIGTVWLIRALFSGGINKPLRETDREDQAIDILNKRYARGELKREEYELMKKDLVDEN